MAGLLLVLAAVLWAGLTLAGPHEPDRWELPRLHENPGFPADHVVLHEESHDFLAGPVPLGGVSCDKDIDLTSTISKVVVAGSQDNIICSTTDIDTYVNLADGETYVVQGGGKEAAITVTHIDAGGSPTMIDQLFWPQTETHTMDVKAFVQAGRNYVALSLEGRGQRSATCGVVFMDVTDSRIANLPEPPFPTVAHQETGADWCDVHNSFVEKDANGEGRYVYLTANATRDMRVLDIANIAATDPPEVGRYASPTANQANYVHDITVIDHGGSVGRRAYLSYWNSGLVILDAAEVTPGVNPIPLAGPNQINPAGFVTHHAYANQAGDRVFIQDEFMHRTGDQPVQMWDVSDPTSPTYVDGLALGADVPPSPAHNLEIRFDIHPDRLYVGWYRLGLEAWDFTDTGFSRRGPSDQRTAVVYHQVQTEPDDDLYSGAWGVRLAMIGNNLYAFQSDREFGLIVGRVLEAVPPTAPTNLTRELTGDNVTTKFTWSRSTDPGFIAPGNPLNTGSGVQLYDVAITRVIDNSVVALAQMADSSCGPNTCEFVPPTRLTAGAYIISVRALDIAGNRSGAAALAFREGNLNVVQNLRVVDPLFGNLVTTHRPTFRWTRPERLPPSGLKAYEVAITGDALRPTAVTIISFTPFTGDQFFVECFDVAGVSKGTGDACTDAKATGDEIQITVEGDLPDGTHGLGVRVVPQTGDAGKPEELVFSVDTQPPSPPALVAPLDGAGLNSGTVGFEWQPSTSDDTHSYRLQVTSADIDTGAFDVDKIVDVPATGGRVASTADLPARGTYSWRVGARDRAGNETASGDLEVRSLNIVDRIVDLTLESDSGVVALGSTFDVRIKVEPNGQPVSFVSALLSFTTGDLEVVSIAGGPTLEVVLAGGFDNAKGTIDYWALTIGTAPTGDFVLATVRFKALAAMDQTRMDFDAAHPRRTGASFGGASVLRDLFGLGIGIVRLEGDADLNGVVDIEDLRLVAGNWGIATDTRADLNGDGIVDIHDLVLVALNLGRRSP